MSTRASIAIKDGEQIKSVYCHFDGYLEYVGKTLYKHYDSAYLAEKLINGGYMSSLGETYEETEFYYPDEKLRVEIDTSLKTFIDSFSEFSAIEFIYLYDTNERQWLFAENSDNLSEKDFWSLGAELEGKNA